MRRSQIYKTLLLWLLLYIWLSAWLNRPWEVFFLYYSLLLIKYGWKKCWTTTTTTTTISSSRNRRQNATQRSNESICQEATDSVMWYNDDNNIYTFIWFRKKKTKTLFKMMNLTPLINTTGPLNYSNSILEASEDEDSSSSSLLLAGSRNHTVSLPPGRGTQLLLRVLPARLSAQRGGHPGAGREPALHIHPESAADEGIHKLHPHWAGHIRYHSHTHEVRAS